ncbi:uncharacterized protein LOC144193352 [Stigmatopora nigra]
MHVIMKTISILCLSMFNRRGRGWSSNSRCHSAKWRLRLHGRVLQSCSELTISRRNSDKLRRRRCCTCCMSSFGDFEAPVLILRAIFDVPQRAPPTTGKHQECGRNDQKGSTGRRHNKGEFHPSQDGLHHSPISDILPDSKFHH